MKDPLAGKRQAVNNGASSLLWPDSPKAPVTAGEIFKLRSCHIEILRCQKIRKGGVLMWRAGFMRIRREGKPMFLKRGGGYTHDYDLAMRSQDDLQAASTIDAIDPDDRGDAHRNRGEPPEPEIVADVADLPTSLEAQQRYELQRAEVRRAETSRPLSERIRSLESARGADLTRQFARIEQGVKAAEAKARRLAPKTPSERCA